MLRARSETVAHRTKLDSDKFGNEARDQTDGLIESCVHLNFSITRFNALSSMIYFTGFVILATPLFIQVAKY